MNDKTKTFILIFLSALLLCHTGCCEYTVIFGESDDNEYTYTAGGENLITFWDLPLWIQILWLSSIIVGLFATIKFCPLIAAKIKYALDNKRRQKILNFIAEHPGRCIEELSDDVNINRETLRYHLVCLENNNHIIIENTDNSKRIFPNHNTYSDRERKIISICNNPIQVKILAIITKYPGIRNSDLKEELNISKSAVSWHIKKLERENLLSCRKSGKSRHYYIISSLEQFIIENMPDEIKDRYDFASGDFVYKTE